MAKIFTVEELQAHLRASEQRLAEQVLAELKVIQKKFDVVPFVSINVERIDVTSLTSPWKEFRLGTVGVNLSVTLP